MTNWLKWRLGALFATSLFVAGSTYLHAQSARAPLFETPEAARADFLKLLNSVRQPFTDSQMTQGSRTLDVNSVKHSQYVAFNAGQKAGSIDQVLQLLASEVHLVPFDAKVKSSQDGQTIVSVVPPPPSKRREIAVVPEEAGGYCVDLVATYGLWHHLSGLEADKALFDATGWISPTLAKEAEFVGNHTFPTCQSNMAGIWVAMRQYAHDYDGKLAPARRWQDVTKPRFRETSFYSCPAVELNGKSNGYAFNSKLSQTVSGGIAEPSKTVQLYETSNLNRNVFAPFTGRAYRHVRSEDIFGINIGFLDGHVEWFKKGTEEQAVKVTPSLVSEEEDSDD